MIRSSVRLGPKKWANRLQDDLGGGEIPVEAGAVLSNHRRRVPVLGCEDICVTAAGDRHQQPDEPEHEAGAMPVNEFHSRCEGLTGMSFRLLVPGGTGMREAMRTRFNWSARVITERQRTHKAILVDWRLGCRPDDHARFRDRLGGVAGHGSGSGAHLTTRPRLAPPSANNWVAMIFVLELAHVGRHVGRQQRGQSSLGDRGLPARGDDPPTVAILSGVVAAPSQLHAHSYQRESGKWQI